VSTYQRRDVEIMLSAFYQDAWDVLDDQTISEWEGAPVESGVEDPIAAARKPTKDKAATGNALAMRVDIGNALRYAGLTKLELIVLEHRYGKQWSIRALAELFNVTRASLETTLVNAVGALVDELNYGTNRKAERDELERKRELQRLTQRAFL